MPDNQDAQTDAEFWVALGYEMQKAEEQAAEQGIQFFGEKTSDHVFHDGPVDLDEMMDPVEPEPIPTWGETFNW